MDSTSEQITSRDSIIDISKEELLMKYTILNKLYSQLQIELELKFQQIYDLKREVTRLTSLEAEYLNEIQTLQTVGDKQCEKLQLKVQNLEKENNDLHHSISKQMEKVEYLEEDLSKRDNKIIKLEEELKLSVINNNDAETNHLLVTELEELKSRFNELANEKIDMREKVDYLENEHLLHREEINHLKQEYETLNENYKCKSNELKEAKVSIETLQEELILAKNDLETAKNTPLQVGSQGNSLFAEVNDRRIEIQNQMATIKADYFKMKKERSKLLSQISTLSSRNVLLSQRWESEIKDKENDDDKVEESYKARIRYLESQLESSKNELTTRQKISATNLDSGEIEFMENMLESKNKQIEKLHQETDSYSFSRMMLSRQLRDSNNEMRDWRAKAAKFENEIDKLKAEIEELKLKDGVEFSNSKIEQTDFSKKSSLQVDLQKPKLSDVIKSLDAGSQSESQDRFSFINCSRQIKKSLLKEQNSKISNKENITMDIEETENVKPTNEIMTKKVQFAEHTVDNEDVNRPKMRKGGKIIHVQPMVLKKKY